MSFSQALCPCFVPPMTGTASKCRPSACASTAASQPYSFPNGRRTLMNTYRLDQKFSSISSTPRTPPSRAFPCRAAQRSPLLETASQSLALPLEPQRTARHKSGRPLLQSSAIWTCSPRSTIGISARSWLCIAATLALCTCFARYPLKLSGPSCPTWINFSKPLLPPLCALKRGTPCPAMQLATIARSNKSATASKAAASA